MNKFFGTAVMAATLAVSGAALADEQMSQQRAIDARAVKVKLGGVIDLRIKQGPTPSLTITGDRRMVEKVSVVQDGDTLSIDTDSRGWHFKGNERGELRAELTLPNLTQLVSHGVGASDVKGFTGQEIKVSLDGAGAVTLDSNYRSIVARLGGVGSMTLNASDAEQVDLKLGGAGAISVNGSSKLLRAQLGGVGSLDARKLTADTVVLDMSGLGGATVHAKNTANLKLSGLGSATVYGKPATRTSEARGLGSVSWQ
ncbi:MAG TPA: DUF2807 domain-containing protein [Telluria sp.]|jgi:hypothetical protein